MVENFNQAWVLLGVGMLTVFSVLLLVVLIGNAIILFVDRFIPVSEASANGKISGKNDPGSSKIAAIVSAVQIVTGGRGQVVKIERKQ